MPSRLRAFGAFVRDFLVGDAPELAAGALLVAGVAALFGWFGDGVRWVAAIGIPVLVAGVLALSVLRAARAVRAHPSS